MKLRPAGYCWLGLTIYVIGADLFLLIQERKGKPNYYTMSSAFRDALRHPVRRWPVILMWLLLTFHLFDFFFPEKLRQLEPIGATGRQISRLTSFPEAEWYTS
jgi:hypothetical protein